MVHHFKRPSCESCECPVPLQAPKDLIYRRLMEQGTSLTRQEENQGKLYVLSITIILLKRNYRSFRTTMGNGYIIIKPSLLNYYVLSITRTSSCCTSIKKIYNRSYEYNHRIHIWNNSLFSINLNPIPRSPDIKKNFWKGTDNLGQNRIFMQSVKILEGNDNLFCRINKTLSSWKSQSFYFLYRNKV